MMTANTIHTTMTLPATPLSFTPFTKSSIATTPTLKACTLNLNGPGGNECSKLTKLFKAMLNDNIHIACLQETHLYDQIQTPAQDNFLVIRCDAPRNGGNAKRGVAIVLRKIFLEDPSRVKVICDDQQAAEPGRVLFVEFNDVHLNHYLVGSLYVPADDDNNKAAFLQSIPQEILSSATFIGMDSNIVTHQNESFSKRALRKDTTMFKAWLDREFPVNVSQPNKIHTLIDVWDILRQDDIIPPFTFARPDKLHGPKKSVIDKFIAPVDIVDRIQRIQVNDSLKFSDHKMVIIQFASMNSRSNIGQQVLSEIIDFDDTLRQTILDKRLAIIQSHSHETQVDEGKQLQQILAMIRFETNQCTSKCFDKRTRELKKALRTNKQKLRKKLAAGKISKQMFDDRFQLLLRDSAPANIRKSVNASIVKQFSRATELQNVAKQTLTPAWKTNTIRKGAKPVIEAVNMPDGSISHNISDIVKQHQNKWETLLNKKCKNDEESLAARKQVLRLVKRYPNLSKINANLTVQDLEAATKIMKNNAPGIDRLNLNIFKYLPVLLEDLVRVWQNRHKQGSSLPEEWTKKSDDHTDSKIRRRIGSRQIPPNQPLMCSIQDHIQSNPIENIGRAR